MYIALWILFCLLASIGAVQALGWIICIMGRPPGHTGGYSTYQVIPLARDPGLLEQQLRYEIHLLRWASTPRPGPLILLDADLGQEAREVCRNMLSGMDGVIVCRPEEVADLICREKNAPARGV